MLHLDKHHKESEENSYASSKNSRDSSPKGVDSFNPVYDEIKLKVTSDQKELTKILTMENYKSCGDSLKDDPHYSTVHSKVGDQRNKDSEAVHCESDPACTKLSKDYEKSHSFSEDIEDQPHDAASTNYNTNHDIGKNKSENFENHAYALVDMKKKIEKKKVNECDYSQGVCTINYSQTGSDGGTPPPAVPPHTPEMLLNDSMQP